MKEVRAKDVKIKGLKPTSRVKKRFLLVKIHSNNSKLEFKEISYLINQHILKILGAYSYGKLGIWILRERYDSEKNTIVFKVTPEGIDLLKATLALGIQHNSNQLKLEVLNVSGTLKQLYGKLK